MFAKMACENYTKISKSCIIGIIIVKYFDDLRFLQIFAKNMCEKGANVHDSLQKINGF